MRRLQLLRMLSDEPDKPFLNEIMSAASDLPLYILTHEFFPKRGGIATVTEEMARAAARMGFQVEVWAPRGDASRDERFPFAVRRLNLKGSQDLSCQLRLVAEWIRQRRKLRKAIVYLSDPGPILAMRFLLPFKKLQPQRLILTFHGSEINHFATNPWRRLAIKRLIQRADRIGVLSEFTRELLTRHFPSVQSKTCLTPGALRSDFQFPDLPKERPEDPIPILTVGRLHPRKGQAFIIEALSALPAALRKKIALWIVGTGSKYGYDERLLSLAEQADFPVIFHGDISNDALQDLYSQASIFAMTSINFRKSVEGFGLVYLEAAAHGLPIVAHRVGGVAEAISPDENGLLVKPGDQEELTQAFAQLIQDSALRERMGANGIAWSRRNTWDQAATRLFAPIGSLPDSPRT